MFVPFNGSKVAMDYCVSLVMSELSHEFFYYSKLLLCFLMVVNGIVAVIKHIIYCNGVLFHVTYYNISFSAAMSETLTLARTHSDEPEPKTISKPLNDNQSGNILSTLL